MSTEERWLPIPGIEGYEVSDLGQIRSLSLRFHRKYNGPHVIAQATNDRGYKRITFKGQGSHFVHRLVLAAFVGPRPEGMEGAHLNGDRSDNRLVNLKWATHVENESHKVAHGTRTQGETHPKAKFTPDIVREIRRRHAEDGATLLGMSKEYGVAVNAIWQVVRRRSWKHVA